MAWVRAAGGSRRAVTRPPSARPPHWVRSGTKPAPATPRTPRTDSPDDVDGWLVPSFDLPDPDAPRAEPRKPHDLLEGDSRVWEPKQHKFGPDLG